MKKIMVSALCLVVCVASATASVKISSAETGISVVLNDERRVIKTEELPEAVTKALASEDYKGWAVKEAALITKGDAKHYEITLSKETETKILHFNSDGTPVK